MNKLRTIFSPRKNVVPTNKSPFKNRFAQVASRVTFTDPKLAKHSVLWCLSQVTHADQFTLPKSQASTELCYIFALTNALAFFRDRFNVDALPFPIAGVMYATTNLGVRPDMGIRSMEKSLKSFDEHYNRMNAELGRSETRKPGKLDGGLVHLSFGVFKELAKERLPFMCRHYTRGPDDAGPLKFQPHKHQFSADTTSIGFVSSLQRTIVSVPFKWDACLVGDGTQGHWFYCINSQDGVQFFDTLTDNGAFVNTDEDSLRTLLYLRCESPATSERGDDGGGGDSGGGGGDGDGGGGGYEGRVGSEP